MESLITLILVPEDELSHHQKQGVLELERQCFGDVDPKEGKEYFYAEVNARILAYLAKKLIGYLILHQRKVEFDSREIIVGGAVGACVAVGMRGRGIGERLMKKGLVALKRYGCAVTCLNADPEKRKTAFELYKRLGFKLMER